MHDYLKIKDLLNILQPIFLHFYKKERIHFYVFANLAQKIMEK